MTFQGRGNISNVLQQKKEESPCNICLSEYCLKKCSIHSFSLKARNREFNDIFFETEKWNNWAEKPGHLEIGIFPCQVFSSHMGSELGEPLFPPAGIRISLILIFSVQSGKNTLFINQQLFFFRENRQIVCNSCFPKPCSVILFQREQTRGVNPLFDA